MIAFSLKLEVMFCVIMMVKCSLKIERGYYSNSKHTFTNPTNEEGFCIKRNATCIYKWKNYYRKRICSKCKCRTSGDTFLSYYHGCLSYTMVRKVLKVSQCMPTSTSSIDKSYDSKKADGPADIQQCKLKVIYYDEKFGKETNFNKAIIPVYPSDDRSNTYIIKRKYCKGRLLKLSIKCPKSDEICYMVLVTGSYDIPETIATVRPQTTSKISQDYTLQVDRHQNSADMFTNPNKSSSFCIENKAKCTQNNCSKCLCNSTKDAFTSYRYGCLDPEILHKKLDWSTCIGQSFESVLSSSDFQYAGSYILNMPAGIQHPNQWSCHLSQISYIDMLSGLETLDQMISFEVQISSIHENKLILKCSSFACDLTNYVGKLLKLDITCKDNTKTKRIISTCFTFKMAGKLQIKDPVTHMNDTETRKDRNNGNFNIERGKSIDYFTNPDKDENFCLQRNAYCESTKSQNCSRCKCSSDHSTFISYDQGCMDVNKYSTLNEIQNCMEINSDVPLISPKSLQRKKCFYWKIPSSHSNISYDFSSCVVDKVISIEPMDGKSNHPNDSFSIKRSRMLKYKDYLCLQCVFYECNLSHLSGMLLKLNVQCADNGKKIFDTCMVFKMNGVLSVNGTFSLTPTKSNLEKNRVSSSTIAAVVTCILVVLIVAAIFLFYWRRRKLRRAKTYCAHNVVGAKKAENTELRTASGYSDVNTFELRTAGDYASLGACAAQPSGKTEDTAFQKEENLYYKSADQQCDERTRITAQHDNNDSNPLYGIEGDRKINEENFYTDADNSEPEYHVVDEGDKELMEENIYTEAANPNKIDNSIGNPVYGLDESRNKNIIHRQVNNDVIDLKLETEYSKVDYPQRGQHQQQHEESNKYYSVGDIVSP